MRNGVAIRPEKPAFTLLVISAAVLIALVMGALTTFVAPWIGFVLLGGVACAALVLRDMRWGFLALIAVVGLLPFGAIPFSVGLYPTFLDVALLALFGVWLARVSNHLDGGFQTSSIDMPVVAFILLAFVSFVVGLGYAEVTRETVRRFAEVILSVSLFFVVVNGVRDEGRLYEMVRAIILVGFAAATIGVVLYFLPQELTISILSKLSIFHYPAGWSVLRFIEDDSSLPMRATSTAIDPNVLGGFLLLVTSLTVPQLFSRAPLFPRWLTMVMVAVMSLCLLLTFSRGSFGGLGAALLLISLLRYRRLFGFLLAAMVVVYLLVPQGQTFLLHAVSGIQFQDKAAAMRLGEYKDALRLISSYPWFGVGFGAAPSIDLYIGVSNVYLLIAEEMGLIGLACFLIAMALFLKGALRALRPFAFGRLSPVLLGLTAAISGALVAGLLDHYFFNLAFPHSVALFWLYLGLAMVAVRLIEARREDGGKAGAAS